MPASPVIPPGSVVRHDLNAIYQEWPMVGRSVAARIFLPMAVENKSGAYYVQDKEFTAHQPAAASLKRQPGTEAAKTYTQLSQDTYDCDERCVEEPVDDTVQAHLASKGDAGAAAAAHCALIIARDTEIEAATLLGDTAVWTGAANTAAASGGAWNLATADVWEDVEAAANQIRGKSGATKDQMSLVLSYARYQTIKRNDSFLDAVKYTSAATEAQLEAMMAAWLGVREVIVGRMNYNSATPSAAFTSAEVWAANKASLVVTAGAMVEMGIPLGPLVPCVGRALYWQPGGGMIFNDQYRDDKIKSTVHRATAFIDLKLHGLDNGFLITGV